MNGGGDASRPFRLVLVRHGQTSSNISRVLDTVLPGPGLTDLGREQARAVGRELAGGDEGTVDALYCSPARRARETATVLAEVLGLAPQVVEGVHEAQVGELEGRNDDESIGRFRAVFGRWQGGDLDVGYTGGETGHDLVTRFRRGLDDVRRRHPCGGTVVLVSHGAALRLVAEVLVERVGTPGPEENHVANCGRVVVEARGTGWGLVSWRSQVPGGLPSVRDATG